MMSLIQFNLPLLAVALAIGTATGAWMFRRPRPKTDERDTISS